jgi:hypothetical protein
MEISVKSGNMQVYIKVNIMETMVMNCELIMDISWIIYLTLSLSQVEQFHPLEEHSVLWMRSSASIQQTVTPNFLVVSQYILVQGW